MLCWLYQSHGESFCLDKAVRNLRIQWQRDLCRVLPSYYCRQHSYPFFKLFHVRNWYFFFFSTTLLSKMFCNTTSLIFERCFFFLPQFTFYSIICIRILFSQFCFNFILRESLKDHILLKHLIFHKIIFLFSGRVTQLLCSFKNKASN